MIDGQTKLETDVETMVDAYIKPEFIRKIKENEFKFHKNGMKYVFIPMTISFCPRNKKEIVIKNKVGEDLFLEYAFSKRQADELYRLLVLAFEKYDIKVQIPKQPLGVRYNQRTYQLILEY